MDRSCDFIFEQNEKWVAQKLKEDPHFFERLAVDQKPEYLFIGCSDSRAHPYEITGLGIGDVFVHRNISNIVNPIDLNVASVIQYAIENLKVKHIIVCGHYGCGGIKAAMEEEGIGRNSPWLQIIKDIYRIHKPELEKIKDLDKRYDRLVELNVLEQMENVTELACIQRLRGTTSYPGIHAWVFDMRTGRIFDLAKREEEEANKPSRFKRIINWFKNLFKRIKNRISS